MVIKFTYCFIVSELVSASIVQSKMKGKKDNYIMSFTEIKSGEQCLS